MKTVTAQCMFQLQQQLYQRCRNKGHFFMKRSQYFPHKLEMIEPGEKYTGLENLSRPGSCAAALEHFQNPVPCRGVMAFGSRCNGDSKSPM